MSHQPEVLRSSFDFCRRLSRQQARNFYYSFLALPSDRRQAMCALYAFFRQTDDLVDEPATEGDKLRAIEEWKRALNLVEEAADCSSGVRRSISAVQLEELDRHWPGLPALAQTLLDYTIPTRLLREVVEGVSWDVRPRDYQTFEELYRYCYLVASTVGLCCVRVWGYQSQNGRAEELAESTGIALQLTNILRDIREDAQRGRIYLPREDRETFGVRDDDLIAEHPSRALRELLAFEARRARVYYASADDLIPLVSPLGRPVLRTLVGIYRRLLDEIEQRDYDVLSQRVRLTSCRKLTILGRSMWWPGQPGPSHWQETGLTSAGSGESPLIGPTTPLRSPPAASSLGASCANQPSTSA